MKIAVPTRDGRVDDHFGHCAYYTIFDVVDGKVVGVSKMASPEGKGRVRITTNAIRSGRLDIDPQNDLHETKGYIKIKGNL